MWAPMKLLLDECITPAGTRIGWDIGRGVDVVHVNHRALDCASDVEVWRRAVADERAMVTINGADFIALAEKTPSHPGLFLMPSGYSRTEQLDCLKKICEFIAAEDAECRELSNRVFCA